MRPDTAGTLQALVGLWQIFCRQGSLPASEADSALAGILTPFASVHSDRDLFDAARGSVKLLLAATGFKGDGNPQDRVIDLLAGAGSPADRHCSTIANRHPIYARTHGCSTHPGTEIRLPLSRHPARNGIRSGGPAPAPCRCASSMWRPTIVPGATSAGHDALSRRAGTR